MEANLVMETINPFVLKCHNLRLQQLTKIACRMYKNCIKSDCTELTTTML